jgi:hypothetical protein
MRNGSPVDHVLLTRFNLPSPGVERMVRAQESRLENRVKLFEKYCLASVKAQTAGDIHWITYFDPESPAWLLERIDEWSAENVFVPIFRATASNSELCADLHEAVSHPGEWLITTNLDNDDALAVDVAHRLQFSAAQAQQPGAWEVGPARGISGPVSRFVGFNGESVQTRNWPCQALLGKDGFDNAKKLLASRDVASRRGV